MSSVLDAGLKRLHLGRDLNSALYAILFAVAILFPTIANFMFGTSAGVWVDFASSAGVYVLLAIGLNVVVGFAGLLDLGYAAFFAIGAYTFGLFASPILGYSPLHHAFHIPFWGLLILAAAVAAAAGALLGAPTLRLRGDYLAIVTLGFGEIVPRLFRYFREWTGGVNGVGSLDLPSLPVWINGPWASPGQPVEIIKNFKFIDVMPYYVVIVALIVLSVILVNNLYRSRLGRAWMAVREDEVAAAAMGVNTVQVKLLAFSIGASFSGFAGCFLAAKLANVTPDNFSFLVSVTILVMVVLGGMGNIPGVIIGALVIYYIQFKELGDLPGQIHNLAQSVGLGFLNTPHGDWVGLDGEVQRLNFVLFGLILVLIMTLRPQGLFPSRLRAQELAKGVAEGGVFDAGQT